MHARTSSSKIHSLGFIIVHPCDAYNDAEVFKQITPLLPFGADNGGISKGSFQRKFKREPTWGIQPTCLRTRKTLNLSMPRLKYFWRWAMVSPINAIFSYPKCVRSSWTTGQVFRLCSPGNISCRWRKISAAWKISRFSWRFLAGTNQLDGE